ncbi:unnamed protein product [Nesidiocoris tenuis]|uniref:Uncharacterized protein n=1 Tax=Nesidiocoris tenuis TaxID=355587 RepID=A0A6H5GUM5_9HEMI|nr:unnamed protein product [Nesidiocoris tenuis]
MDRFPQPADPFRTLNGLALLTPSRGAPSIPITRSSSYIVVPWEAAIPPDSRTVHSLGTAIIFCIHKPPTLPRFKAQTQVDTQTCRGGMPETLVPIMRCWREFQHDC